MKYGYLRRCYCNTNDVKELDSFAFCIDESFRNSFLKLTKFLRQLCTVIDNLNLLLIIRFRSNN